MTGLIATTPAEKQLLQRLSVMDRELSALREQLRQGGEIVAGENIS
ncbi:MAG: hypothetical protein PVH64_03255 [Bacillota bacterium]|jgi:hypothetical protein